MIDKLKEWFYNGAFAIAFVVGIIPTFLLGRLWDLVMPKTYSSTSGGMIGVVVTVGAIVSAIGIGGLLICLLW